MTNDSKNAWFMRKLLQLIATRCCSAGQFDKTHREFSAHATQQSATMTMEKEGIVRMEELQNGLLNATLMSICSAGGGWRLMAIDYSQ